MILSNTPSLDLHGMDREYAVFKVKEFLYDMYQLHYDTVIIIHGRGTGTLKTAIYQYLKTVGYVSEYKLDFMNPGCTIVKLKSKPNH